MNLGFVGGDQAAQTFEARRFLAGPQRPAARIMSSRFRA
jgi:hypothetical protein